MMTHRKTKHSHTMKTHPGWYSNTPLIHFHQFTCQPGRKWGDLPVGNRTLPLNCCSQDDAVALQASPCAGAAETESSEIIHFFLHKTFNYFHIYWIIKPAEEGKTKYYRVFGLISSVKIWSKTKPTYTFFARCKSLF